MIAALTALPSIERPSYVLYPYKWGSGLRGTSGGVITWSASAQIPTDNPYTDSAAVMPPSYLDTLRAAFARWNQVGNFTFVETTDGVNADIHIVFDELESRSSSTLGLAQTFYGITSGAAREAFISFDIGRRYRTNDGVIHSAGSVSSTSTIYNFYAIALHEIGHALGLDHENDFATLMNSYYSPSVADLTSDEINGVRALYGSPGSIPTSDDYTSDNTTAGRITIGGNAPGTLEYGGDVDWFSVTLTAGTNYQFGIVGGTLLDPYLIVRNSSGTIVASDDDAGVGLNAQLTYTPTASGTFYLEARGATISGAGTYTASVAVTTTPPGGGAGATIDDYAGSTATTGTLAVGGSISGNLESGGDSDWFRVTLTAGTNYHFGITGGTLTDPYLNVRNGNGTIVASDDDSGAGLNSDLTYTPTTSGIFYLDVRGATTVGTGTYAALVTVAISSGVSDDYASNSSTTGMVSIGGSYTGNIEHSGDHDWFRITATAGTIYQVNVNGSSLTDPYVMILNVDGNLVASDDDSGAGLNAQALFKARLNGTYYVDVSGSQSFNIGAYTGSVTVAVAAGALPSDDYGDTTLANGTLAIGGSVTATLNANYDEDWFAVSLVAGGVYRFNVDGITLVDPFLIVYDANGGIITSDDDSGVGLNSQLTYTAPKTATYYLSVLGSSGTGSYRASATALSLPTPADDFSGSAATSGTVTVGGSRSGNIETGSDSDWFRITLTAGTAYLFDLAGGTLADPYLYVRDVSGTALVSDNDSGPGLNSQISFTPSTSGTYYLDVRGAAAAAMGTYTLSAALAPDDYGATITTAAAIAMNNARTGAIENGGDADWFSVTFSAGVLYEIDVTASATNTGTLSNPRMTLLGTTPSGGTVALASDEDGGIGNNAQLIYTATTGGTHYIAVDSVDPKATGTYTARVMQIADDYVASVSTTGSLVVNGTATGRIDALSDTDWFRITLNGNGRYRFFVSGSDSNGGTLFDTTVSVYDGTGNLVVSADNGGFGSDGLVLYTPSLSGTYYIAASGLSTGTYTVGALQQTVDDYSAGTSTTGSIAIGGTIRGMMEATGDHDWFRVTLTAGSAYLFNVLGTALGAGLREADSYLWLRDANGAEAAKAEAHGAGISAQLTYTAQTSGTYYLDVQAYAVGGGSYLVNVTTNSAALTARDVTVSQHTSEMDAVTAPPEFDLSLLGATPAYQNILEAADGYDDDALTLLRANQRMPTPLFSAGAHRVYA